MRLHEFPRPNGELIQAILKNHKRDKAKRKRELYEEKGVNTGQDMISREDLKNLSKWHWNGGTATNLRNRCDLLLSRALISRGQIQRYLELSDLYVQQLPDEGPHGAYALVVNFDKSKTNQDGKDQRAGALRNKEVELCAVGSLALYFFKRFVIDKEPFPDMEHRENWYYTPLFKGAKKSEAMSYDGQYNAVRTSFKANGIHVSVATHLGRKLGAADADHGGASTDHTKRQGQWSRGAYECSYLDKTLPLEALRTLAGFRKDIGNYYIPRASIDPPYELKEMVFPALPEARRKFNKFLSTLPLHRDIAGSGFIKLMDYLATVVLQDAAVLMEIDDFKESKLFQQSLFKCDEFKNFKDLIVSANSQPVPEDLLLRQVLPALHDNMQTIASSVATNGVRADALLERLTQLQTNLNELKDSLQLTFLRQPRREATVAEGFARIFQDSSRAASRLLSSLNETAELSSVPSTTTPTDENQTSATINVAANIDAAPLATARTSVHVINPMSANLQTIEQVMTEYSFGIDGNPSIRSLNAEQGTGWRKEPKINKFYSRRSAVYKV